jgi:aspartyl-tRNA(Asn)/glutamyl-tRNA(Gln) amidotransferase subunit A
MSLSVGDQLASRRTFLKTATVGAFSSLFAGITPETSSASESARPTNSGDLTKMSMSEAADLIRRRKVSPVELTRACLARIERLNPALNCFITVTGDTALAQAREAESEIQRGRWRGPLHGIPIALKDLFDTAGVKTTAGSALFKDRIPTEDAEVVRRLKGAGAVLLGKTNMVEFAYGSNSAVSYFGAVNNPWDLAAIAGGSSSGSGAAVAAGLCFGALGSDTAGSVRIPAAICGIVGLKPTYGLVSNRGVIPLSWSLDHVGPMTRTVADNALLLHAIAGYDPAETTSIRVPIPNYRATLGKRTSALRVGVPREFFFENLDPEVEVAIMNALSVLRRLTAGLRDVVLPSRPEQQESIRSAVRAAEAYSYHFELVNKTPDLYQSETLARIRSGADVTARAYLQGRRDLAQARRAIERAFENVDVLVTPTITAPPPSTAEMSKDLESSARLNGINIHNTSPFNVWGIPTISVPCGFTHKTMPIGLQISGPNGGEAVVLQLAQTYERATDWHTHAPEVKV